MKYDTTVQALGKMQDLGVPEHLQDGLNLYLHDHLHVGHFLTAVLSNDLTEAVARGDDRSLAGLQAVVRYLYNYAPREAWGSKERVNAWLDNTKSEGGE